MPLLRGCAQLGIIRVSAMFLAVWYRLRSVAAGSIFLTFTRSFSKCRSCGLDRYVAASNRHNMGRTTERGNTGDGFLARNDDNDTNENVNRCQARGEKSCSPHEIHTDFTVILFSRKACVASSSFYFRSTITFSGSESMTTPQTVHSTRDGRLYLPCVLIRQVLLVVVYLIPVARA